MRVGNIYIIAWEFSCVRILDRETGMDNVRSEEVLITIIIKICRQCKAERE